MEDKIYKMGVYASGKLIYKTEVYARSIEEAREFTFEQFEAFAYAEEIEEEEKN